MFSTFPPLAGRDRDFHPYATHLSCLEGKGEEGWWGVVEK